jgi:DHA1 family bicyclomycin/chloramphenicol resistance-like MFS transporter
MTNQRQNKGLIIFILGLMTALSPFSIDMYLPAFQNIANDFNTTVAQISLSLSSYFIGLSFGQLFYGPLLDRYGRKKPLYMGLLIYIISAIFCLNSTTAEFLIAWRFAQAIGGCAAGVASMSMVRDLFTTKESAKVFSWLILILGISPLLAPTVGGYLTAAFGWHAVFLVLAMIAGLLFIIVKFKLPETRQPDPSVLLQAGPIFKNYAEIIAHPEFYTYAFSSSVSFSGLFVYLAGSPIIFMQTFNVSPQVYGWIFAIVAAGMIISSQFNSFLLKKFSNEQLLMGALSLQVLVAFVFLGGNYLGWYGLIGTVFMLFLFMACFGLTSPNGGALALAPFSKNAGSASALIGFLQMGTGALASASIGLFNIKNMLPVIAAMTITSSLAITILVFGKRRIKSRAQSSPVPLDTNLPAN